MDRARRAMELLHLAEATKPVYGWERPAAVAAARDVLQDEFNDVRLQWSAIGHDIWELEAKGPNGPGDHAYASDFDLSILPWKRRWHGF